MHGIVLHAPILEINISFFCVCDLPTCNTFIFKLFWIHDLRPVIQSKIIYKVKYNYATGH